MKKIFCKESSVSGCGGERRYSHRTPPLPRSGKVYRERPWEDNDSKMMAGEELKDENRPPRASFAGPIARHPRVTRSLSHSSTFAKGRRSLSDGQLGSPSTIGDSMYRSAECSVNCHSPTSERTKTTRGNISAPQRSPVPRCRNRSLELYFDWEHEEMNLKNVSQIPSSNALFDGYLGENRVHLTTEKPPQARSMASSSLSAIHKDLAYLFSKETDFSKRLRLHAYINGETIPNLKNAKRSYEKQPKIFPGETVMRLPDHASKTTAETEDVNVDSSNAQPTANYNVVAQHCCTKSTDAIPPYANMNDSSMDWKMDNMIGSGGTPENITDEELYEKQKEVEQMFMLISEDLEMEELRKSSLNSPALLQTMMNITKDRRHLVLELSSQIKCRLAERSASNERLKQAIFEADIRTRRVEKEKRELQSRLEKELDRRSSSCSLKLEKLPHEEEWLCERVRELSEQNVLLQRETSLLKGNKIDMRSRLVSYEMQVNKLTAYLKEARMENHNLLQSLSELKESYKGAEEENSCIRKKYKETEKENRQLQEVIARSERICSEKEKIINVLRQGYSKEASELSMEGSNNSSSWKMKHLHLVGVEQMLGKELEPYRNELEQMLRKEADCRRNEIVRLRHENMCLMDRLQFTANSYGFSSSKVEKVVHACINCLKTQGLSLLDDCVHFSGELLGLMTRKQYVDLDGYNECTLKYQNLKIKIEKFKETFPTILTIMDEKSILKAQLRLSETVEDTSSRASHSQRSEDKLQHESETESLPTGVLQETQCSEEIEIVQLDADLSSSARAVDILQTETQRPQYEISSHTHTAKDMERQMIRKDESRRSISSNMNFKVQ